jgi:streptogramin lyase
VKPHIALLAATVAVSLAASPPAASAAPSRPPLATTRAALKAVPVATGLNGPSGFTFAPDGAIWYLERGTGEVHRLVPSTDADHRVTTIGGVDGSGDAAHSASRCIPPGRP